LLTLTKEIPVTQETTLGALLRAKLQRSPSSVGESAIMSEECDCEGCSPGATDDGYECGDSLERKRYYAELEGQERPASKRVRIERVYPHNVPASTHGLLLDLAGTVRLPRDEFIPKVMAQLGVRVDEAMTAVCKVQDTRREIDALEAQLAALQERLIIEQLDAQLRMDDLTGRAVTV